MKKLVVSVVLTLVFLFGVMIGLYKLMNSTTIQLAGEIVNHVDTQKKVVALTFDDGPTEHTAEILEILAEREVSATFYLIGEQLAQYPEEAQNIVTAGHQLGNHSYTHQRMVFKSPEFVAAELEKTTELLQAAGYQGEVTFRPPYGKKLVVLPFYLAKNNIKTIMWDLDPLQTLPATATSQEVSEFVVTHAQPGSIILIHPWYGEENASRDAIPLIIDSLKNEGYEFVTVNELLEHLSI